jgi:nucleoside-diphosphate-sugar epimerase
MACRVLVTGASGFLGGRLVEKMLRDSRWSLRAMAHRPGKAVRLARNNVEIVWADLLKKDEVEQTVSGVDIVVHCAYGTDTNVARAVTVDGTRLLIQAAQQARVKRFVHISTISVHSYSPPPVISEDSPYVPSGDMYCDAKIAAERIVRKNDLPGVVLRMGNIYGPNSLPWTVRPLAHIRAGKVSLVEGGGNASNMVFVDNAVEAILRSLDSDRAVGEVFFITDDPCSWREIYGAYARWLGDMPLRSATQEEIRPLVDPTHLERIVSAFSEVWSGIVVPSVRYTAFRAAVSPTIGPFLSSIWQKVPETMRYRIVGDPLGRSVPAAVDFSDPTNNPYPPPGLLALYAGRAVFSNEKAKRILGLGPGVSWESALERTRLWAEWARLIGPTG